MRRAVLLLSLLAGVARAQSDAELAEARRELAVAHAAQAPGEAAAHFERAAALSHQPAILAEAGRAWQKQWESTGGLEPLRRARADYREYLKRVPVASERAAVESAARAVDEEWSKLLRGQREQLIAAAEGAGAVALAEEFLGLGDLDAAEAALDRFDRASGAGRAEVARAYAARGRLAATRGDAKSAGLFVAALELEPSLPPPPELEKSGRAAFGKAQGQLRGRAPLRLSASAPRHARAGAVVSLGVTSEGDVAGLVRKVEVRWRAGEGEFATASGRTAATVTVPAGAEWLKWQARVLGDHDALLGEVGSAAQPLTLPVERRAVAAAAPSKPLWKRWELWVGVGAAALAVIAVGTAVGVVESPPPRTSIPVAP